MKTLVLGTSDSDLQIAADIIRQGGLVAFPTETVYGLGADALNPEAVRKIYEVKGRPADNPSIVHIASLDELPGLCTEITDDMRTLAEKFWPGPMTMIVKRDPKIPDVTTGGLETVGIRFPKGQGIAGMICKSGLPIAGPSANISGKPSPTCAQHVLDDFDGRIEAVIDEGPCPVGIESVVIDMTGETPMILRPGYITKEEFEEALGKEILLDPTLNQRPDPSRGDFRPKAPGQKYKHYAPNAEMILYAGEPEKVKAAMLEEQKKREADGRKTLVLFFDEAHEKEAAREFFAQLRQADRDGVEVILASALPEEGLGFSIMNRMLKSSGFHIVEVK